MFHNAAQTQPAGTISGFNTIKTTSGTGASASVSLTMDSVSFNTNGGSVLNLLSGGTSIGSATNKIFVQNLPTTLVATNSGSILPNSMVSGTAAGSLNFVKVATVGLTNEVGPVTSYVTNPTSVAWESLTSQDLVEVTATTINLDTLYTIGGLIVRGNNIGINGNGNVQIATGQILNTNATNTTHNQINLFSITLAKNDGSYVEGFIGNDSTAGLTFVDTDGGGIGNIAPSAISLTRGALTIGGPGKLTLLGDNSYTGVTALTSGTLVLSEAGALGQTASAGSTHLTQNYLLATGGHLQSGVGAGLTIPYEVRLSTGRGELTFSGANPLTLTGPVNQFLGILDHVATAPGGGQESGSINIDTDSTLTYQGSTSLASGAVNQNIVINNYTGTTTVTRGVLAISLRATLGAGGTALRIVPYRGPVVIKSQGILRVVAPPSPLHQGNQSGIGFRQNADGGLVPPGLPYTIDGGTLDWIGMGTNAGTIRGLTFTNGGTVLLGEVNLTLETNVLARASTNLALITATTGSLGLHTNTPLIAVQGTGPGLEISASIRQTGNATGGQSGFSKIGQGVLTLSGSRANVFTGAINLNEGTVRFAKTAAVNAFGGNLILGNGAGVDRAEVTSNFPQLPSTGRIMVSNSGTLDISAPGSAAQTIGGLDIRGGVVNTGARTLILNGITPAGGSPATDLNAYAVGNISAQFNGILNLGPINPANVTVLDTPTANGLKINGVVAGLGTGISKRGPGTLELLGSTSNTYNGATIVSEGTLLINKSGGVNEIQRLTFSGSPTAGTFRLVLDGASTGVITYSTATATLVANIQTALDNLPTIGPGNTLACASKRHRSRS